MVTQNIIDKTKNRESLPSLEVVEVVLVQGNLVDNQYEQKSEELCTFTPNKFYAFKPASKKVVHKAAETTGELIENKIAVPDENSRNVE